MDEWIDDLYWQLLGDPIGRWTLKDIDEMDIFYYIKLLKGSKKRLKKKEQFENTKLADESGVF